MNKGQEIFAYLTIVFAVLALASIMLLFIIGVFNIEDNGEVFNENYVIEGVVNVGDNTITLDVGERMANKLNDALLEGRGIDIDVNYKIRGVVE